MVPGITGKWVLNATNLPGAELRALKTHLLKGLPIIRGNQDNTALVSDGGLQHQKTTKSGSDLSIKVLDHDNSDWTHRLFAGEMFIYLARIIVTRC